MEMRRQMGVERQEVGGKLFTAVNNDSVLELQQVASDSVDLVVTSWPFSDQYEYTPTYNDFGHNAGDEPFFEQMEYLTPGVVRALKPGRLYCVHAKDRIVFGGVSGDGMYSVSPFSDKCVAHLQRHGLRFVGRITVVTDVVRENNQTYRLGWSEQCKDGTKMGCGMPEYVLLFRKLPTDRTRSYADEPVRHDKATYTRARWQFDAHGFWRSSGDRFLSPEEVRSLDFQTLRKRWHAHNGTHVYDFAEHVRLAQALEDSGRLPASFMLLDPVSHSEWVWDDVVRMRTLNGEQTRRRAEQHTCPLQFDIVERLIERYSNPGELVLDPFGGIGTVGYCAVKMGRRAYTVELSPEYHNDAVGYLRAAEAEISMPTLFDTFGAAS
jgi:DNA modification methylase